MRQYQLLIQKSVSRVAKKGEYYEKHHIIPKSQGGDNSKHNLVLLTAREHFIAHMLLAKIYGGGLWKAATMMKNARPSVQKRYVNSRLYEIAKREWASFMRGKPKPLHVIEAIRAARLGKPLSEETKRKMSEVRKGRARSGDPSKWKHSEKAKKKMSDSRLGVVNHMTLPEHRARMSGENNPMKTEQARKKVSEAKKLYWQKIREKKERTLNEQ